MKWKVHWPHRQALRNGMAEGIPPFPLEEKEIVTNMDEFFWNWILHKKESIFHSILFPPDIPMNKNLKLVDLEIYNSGICSFNDLILLERWGIRFKKTKKYKEVKLPEMLIGLGT